MQTHNHYMFPLVVEKSEDGALGLYFPDFTGTAILANDISSAIRQAREVLAFRLIELEQQNLPIPKPSNPENIELLDPSDRVVFVDIYMPPFRDEAANKAVTKNCTLPRWLRDAAEDAGLNFSQLLQTAIKEALHIKADK